MGDEQDIFEAAAAELEKSISQEKKPEEPANLAGVLMKAATEFLSKGKGGNPTDLQAEKDKRGSLVESGKDPAENPVKSGQGYKDTAKYEARKGHKKSSDGKASSDGKHSSDGDMPSFFKKKKKKMKKADESEVVETENEVVDGTEFIEELSDAVDHINKSVAGLEEGLACFGELLTDLADPRKDKLMVNIAKGLSKILDDQAEIKKSLQSHNALIKSIATMPGMPRVAGMAVVNEIEGELAPTDGQIQPLTKAQRDRVFTLRSKGKCSADEVKKARAEGKIDDLIERLSK